MDITASANAVKLLNSLTTRKSEVCRLVEPTQPKPCFEYGYEYGPLCSPESVGISSDHIRRFYTSLMAEPSLDMHTVTVARADSVISRANVFPYRTDIPHISHSLCKSVVGIAVGILVDRGLLRLDEKISDIFSSEKYRITPIIRSKLTVRHLLTMSSGALFNEIGSLTEYNWVKSFLEYGAKFIPGQQFEYNSMNSYMLCAVIVKKTKMSVSDFVYENIFKYIGIDCFYWETCPYGIEKGGWGLYIYPEDVMKLGKLVLQNGMYDSRRIVSEKWMSMATRPQIKTPQLTGDYDYGFQMWVNEKHGEVLFNGMFGQNLHIFKKTRMLIMTTAGNGDIFQRCRSYPVIRRYFGEKFKPNRVLEESAESLAALRQREKNMYKKNTVEQYVVSKNISDPSGFMQRTDKLNYITDRSQSVGISIFPSLAQAVHNTFSAGIEKVSFANESDGYYITFYENAGTFKLKIGFDRAEYQTVYYNSEPYAVAVFAEAVTDEDKRDVLKLTVAYTELPNTKHFKIYFYDRSIQIHTYENPGYDFALTVMSTVARDSANGNIVKTVGGKLTKEVRRGADRFLRPVIDANLTT